MDLDTNLEIGDRIFAGEWCLLGLSLSVRVFICSYSFCSSNWNGLLVAHLVRPMETTTSVDQKETDRQTVLMM